ncbi:MAG: hypothetical protein GY719_38040 [bacterium]|nr:hypothetical protein [bacterium]
MAVIFDQVVASVEPEANAATPGSESEKPVPPATPELEKVRRLQCRIERRRARLRAD